MDWKQEANTDAVLDYPENIHRETNTRLDPLTVFEGKGPSLLDRTRFAVWGRVFCKALGRKA